VAAEILVSNQSATSSGTDKTHSGELVYSRQTSVVVVFYSVMCRNL
jgi:hypothetical protein